MTTRFCQRCGKELTDAASMNEGIGPVCRKMDNEVLAQLIPANVPKARERMSAAIDAGLFRYEECRKTAEQVIADLADEACCDWRATVKRVEWLLSFAHFTSVKEELIGVADALGYSTLALVWTYQSGVPGKATVRVGEGYIFVKGPRNKMAIAKIREVPGRRFNGDTKEWYAPLASAETFALAVRTGYPKHELPSEFKTWDDLLAFAKKSATASSGEARARVRVKIFGGLMMVESPKCWPFIEAIKGLPYRDRRWNPEARMWEVREEHRKHVLDAAKRCFGAPAEITEA